MTHIKNINRKVWSDPDVLQQFGMKRNSERLLRNAGHNDALQYYGYIYIDAKAYKNCNLWVWGQKRLLQNYRNTYAETRNRNITLLYAI